ncbi:MAG TPA: BT_3928 family protein [Chitinophagaceae bacterium]|nr:BT_3928 family protein [Chitinophagaceae bacterium]
MKKRYLAIRWIVGLLFIFSGLIKANDPLGLSYKMQEFFEAWGLNGSLNDYTLVLSLVMNVFEVLAGVAVIIGWRMKLFSWLLLLLIIFFSFLTGYALLSGKIKTCGCFGDCLPLTPLESFLKDLFLLLLILVLFINKKRIISSLSSPLPQVLLIICIVAVGWLQWYVLKNLPLLDCLPYKPGKNIVEEMKVPAGAIPDSFALTFRYRKNGKIVEFDQNHFPADYDSTYIFVDRYDKLVRKASATAKIVDFALYTVDGTDTTLPVLNQGNYYVMLFANTLSYINEWRENMQNVLAVAKAKGIPFFVVTSEKDKAASVFEGNPDVHVLICDGTVIKTAARVNPTYFIMKQAYIKGKWSYTRADKVTEMLKSLQ